MIDAVIISPEVPNSADAVEYEISLNNYPNPFNPTTTIVFSNNQDEQIELSIFNIKGQKVKQLISERLIAGQHSVLWDGKDDSGNSVSSGVYFYKLDSAGKLISNKMILLK